MDLTNIAVALALWSAFSVVAGVLLGVMMAPHADGPIHSPAVRVKLKAAA